METSRVPMVVRLNATTMPMDDEERSLLATLGGHLVEVEGATDEEIVASAREADAIMVVSAYMRGPVIAQLRRCRVISRLGTGVDKIDIDQATRQGILVTNLPDFCTDEVADHTMALLLAAARRLPYYDSQMRQGRKPLDIGYMHRLTTQTMGLIGFGRIGRAVAQRAKAFGMTVMAYDPYVMPEEFLDEGVIAAGFADVLRQADYLCLLCPLLPSTRAMLDLRAFRQMKPSAVLVNTGRGELVVEEDLVTALREGIIRFAALDVFAGINVFAPEVFPTSHPLFTLENVLLTPHVAAASQEALSAARLRGAQAVVDVLTDHLPQHLVNPGVVPWWQGAQPRTPLSIP